MSLLQCKINDQFVKKTNDNYVYSIGIKIECDIHRKNLRPNE